MANLQERFDKMTADLETIGGTLTESGQKLQEGQTEILAELEKLRAGGELTPEQESALQNVEARVTATGAVATAINDAAKALADISPPVGGG